MRQKEYVTNCCSLCILTEQYLVVLSVYIDSTMLQVLIFSQMTKMLDLIEDYCYVREHKYCRLDGQTDLNSRREQVYIISQEVINL